ncbi:MAG: hypothetical protein RIM33_05720 [Alphaproteobacteria bacterium]
MSANNDGKTADGKAEFIKPAPLADKVPPMGGPNPAEALRRAEQAIRSVAAEFDDILAEELAVLDELMVGYHADPSEENLNKLFRRVHNLRGQGTTMGFPLVTRIGNSFCGYVIERDEKKAIKPALIDQHLKALHIVLKEKRTNSGDQLAEQVAAALEEAVAKEKG